MGAVMQDRQARLLARLADADATLSELTQRVADGEGLFSVCRAWDVPSGRVMEWLRADVKRYEKYLMALQMGREVMAERAADRIEENLSIADDVDEDKLAIAKANLRAKVRKDLAEFRVSMAGVMSPERYKAVADDGRGGGITVIVNRDVASGGAGGVVEIQATRGGVAQSVVVSDDTKQDEAFL